VHSISQEKTDNDFGYQHQNPWKGKERQDYISDLIYLALSPELSRALAFYPTKAFDSFLDIISHFSISTHFTEF
jgi:hypothetical protein